MKSLIDTHTLIWAVDDPKQLGLNAVGILTDSSVGLLVSAGTLWELAIKVGLGKLTLAMELEVWLKRALQDLQLEVLPISVDHVCQYRSLPQHHKDPFDRLLIAQSLQENIPIVGADIVFDHYGVQRIW